MRESPNKFSQSESQTQPEVREFELRPALTRGKVVASERIPLLLCRVSRTIALLHAKWRKTRQNVIHSANGCVIGHDVDAIKRRGTSQLNVGPPISLGIVELICFIWVPGIEFQNTSSVLST